MDRYFRGVVGGDDVSRGKPDPEVFLLAASLLGVRAEEAVVVEDAASGVQAAVTGGFRVVGLCNGGNDPRADITIRRLFDLTEVL